MKEIVLDKESLKLAQTIPIKNNESKEQNRVRLTPVYDRGVDMDTGVHLVRAHFHLTLDQQYKLKKAFIGFLLYCISAAWSSIRSACHTHLYCSGDFLAVEKFRINLWF